MSARRWAVTGSKGMLGMDLVSVLEASGHDVRRFDSLGAAAVEAGQSRIYGGIHYPVANTAGQALGRCIADHVLARFDNGRFVASPK